ncbi:hypothetical protein SAMN05444365_101710 [Micromonospora pattaloongensis]|uniref:Copper(I)-binding protein n=1 Tax=Micromonospora pattaloongensis TaxID=405436 RepID=A0A1H3H970_9ACTN|nr:copper chaperone PCu(A)C [Micromonospora pattaloongensis]SDY11324.1 hypothetical protein SAMN05444365_101710 [Micromonospora pattaloongensis]
MTRSIRGTRRAAVLLAGAAASALLLAGCGTGQLAETALKDSAVPGVNADSRDGAIQLRNLLVPYKDPKGYPAGSSAPISVALYNMTGSPITVRITTAPPQDPESKDSVLSGRSVSLVAAGAASPGASPGPSASVTAIPSGANTVSPSASASPSDSASPSGAPAESASPSGEPERPAEITIPAGGSAIFLAGSNREGIQVNGLDRDLVPGKSVNLVFEFEHNGERQELHAAAPVGLPLSPAPRGSAGHDEISGGH